MSTANSGSSEQTDKRTRNIAKSLSVVAREMRASKQRRVGVYRPKAYQFEQGKTDRTGIARLVAFGIFLAVNVINMIYYTAVATEQYESELRFTVRGGFPGVSDNLSEATGMPSVKLVQDTQIITNYIDSPDLVKALDQKVDIRGHYSAEDIDFFSRLTPDSTTDDLTNYWEGKVDTNIQLPGGLVTVNIRAFTPEKAREISQAVLEISETVVNSINDRLWTDFIATSQAFFETSAELLRTRRAEMEDMRRRTGIVTIEDATRAQDLLIAELRTTIIEQEAEYQSLLVQLREGSPALRTKRSEIDALREQLEELVSNEVTDLEDAFRLGSNSALLDNITEFAVRELDLKIAEEQFAAAVKTLEGAQIQSRQQFLYLSAFVAPNLPHEVARPVIWYHALLGLIFAAAMATIAFLVIRNSHRVL